MPKLGFPPLFLLHRQAAIKAVSRVADVLSDCFHWWSYDERLDLSPIMMLRVGQVSGLSSNSVPCRILDFKTSIQRTLSTPTAFPSCTRRPLHPSLTLRLLSNAREGFKLFRRFDNDAHPRPHHSPSLDDPQDASFVVFDLALLIFYDALLR